MRAAVLVALLVSSAPATAADVDALFADGAAPALPRSGVACEAPIVASFPSVWRGRFQGGYSHDVGVGGPVVLDWRHEDLCFPDRVSCRHFVADMRADFHKPQGYFTCLPIR